MQERVAEFKEMEMGRRLLDLQSMASNLSAAAERLTKEIGLEERYWAEVIQVAAGGWSIFRMAQQPHTMGVKFGFPSATWPEARYNSTAPLGRADDGSVQLQLGKLAGSSKRLQVTITENSRIVGQSSLPAALGPDAPLGERVKEARDSVFAHELWHELNRECRRLLPLGVSLEQDAIVYQMDEQRVMSFQLADLEESDVDNPGLVAQENDLAESMVIIPQILLSQAHKQLVRKRGEAKRRNDDKSSARGHTSTARGSSPPFKLLEPIVTHMKHEQSLRFCTHLFSELTAVLQSAGIQAASCTMVEPLFAPLATARDAAASPADSLVQTLLVPPVVQLDITLTPETRIRVHADPSPLFGTRYLISLLPPRDAPTAGDAATRQAQEALSNPLLDLFPSLVPGEPSPAYAVIGQADAHYSQDNLVWYVENALPRALAARYMGMVQRQEATDSEPDDGWVLRIDRAGICNRETEQYGVSFNVVTNGGNTELQAVAILPQDGTTQTVEWSWTAEGGRQDQQPTLDEVVQKVLGSKLVPAQCA